MCPRRGGLCFCRTGRAFGVAVIDACPTPGSVACPLLPPDLLDCHLLIFGDFTKQDVGRRFFVEPGDASFEVFQPGFGEGA